MSEPHEPSPPSSGNRWEAGPADPGGSVATAEPPLEPVPGTAPPAPPSRGARLRAALVRHRLTLAGVLVGLLLGGLVGFGIGHAVGGHGPDTGDRVGPGRGVDGGFGRDRDGFGRDGGQAQP